MATLASAIAPAMPQAENRRTTIAGCRTGRTATGVGTAGSVVGVRGTPVGYGDGGVTPSPPPVAQVGGQQRERLAVEPVATGEASAPVHKPEPGEECLLLGEPLR